MKKVKTKVIILIIIVILILSIFLFYNKSKSNNYFQDDIIFFKLFSKNKNDNIENTKNQINLNNIYYFQVSYKNIDFKNIYLSDTINKKTLIREKIAPRNKRFF